MNPAWTLAVWLPEDDFTSLAMLVARGFHWVALQARVDRPAAHLDALAEVDLVVACARLRGDLTLTEVSARRTQLHLLQRQVADAALLGATLVWLPVDACQDQGADETGGVYLSEALELLVAFAGARQVRVAVSGGEGRLVREGVGLALPLTDTDGIRRAGGRTWLVWHEGEKLSATEEMLLAEIGFRGVVVCGVPFR